MLYFYCQTSNPKLNFLSGLIFEIQKSIPHIFFQYPKMNDHKPQSNLNDERRLIELSGNYQGDFSDIPIQVQEIGYCEKLVLWLLMILPSIVFGGTVYFLQDLVWGYFWLLIGGHCFVHQI
jgi:hypothetical protein